MSTDGGPYRKASYSRSFFRVEGKKMNLILILERFWEVIQRASAEDSKTLLDGFEQSETLLSFWFIIGTLLFIFLQNILQVNLR